MEAPLEEPNATAGAGRRRAAFAFIFATVLLDMLAIGIVIPVLPKLVVDFMAGDAEQAAKILGLFGTAWALMQFLFSPLQGALSDRFGRRTMILISNFGVGLDYIVMAVAPTLGWLFVGRVDLRDHRREHLDLLRVRRRRDAGGSARGALRTARRRVRRRISCSDRRSAAWPAASRRGCRSGSPRA